MERILDRLAHNDQILDSDNKITSDEEEISNGAQIPDDGGNEVAIGLYANFSLYSVAKIGSVEEFSSNLNQVSAAENTSLLNVCCRTSPIGNTVLHNAAKHGNVEVVNYIVSTLPSIVLFSKNYHGDTALHIAAKAGKESVVRALVSTVDSDRINLLREQNARGNTALQEALSNRWESVSQYLIPQDAELLYNLNKYGESALYLAVRSGFVSCVSSILAGADQQRMTNNLVKKSHVKAAIAGKSRDIVEAMLNTNLIQIRDGKGRIPLHYAASLGDTEVVRYLLTKYSLGGTQKDKWGSFPVHLAATKGHVNVVRLLLQECHDPEEFLDKKGRNVLHLAAEHGRNNVVRYILKNHDLSELINMQDEYGDTPLHLAATKWHARIVSTLTRDKRVKLQIANDKEMTALDAAHSSINHSSTQFFQRLTWMALKAAGTPRLQRNSHYNNVMHTDYGPKISSFLVVSTLVTTIAFAIGFTVPGGYTTSQLERDKGTALLSSNKTFRSFVLSNAVAMYSSLLASMLFICAQLWDHNLRLRALDTALSWLCFSLTMMGMTFATRMWIVVRNVVWLRNVVALMAALVSPVFYCLLPLLLAPSISDEWMILRLAYHSFTFLMIITGN